MHDQAAALLNVAKHIGMFKTRVEHTGKGGGAIPIRIVGINIIVPAEDLEESPDDDGTM